LEALRGSDISLQEEAEGAAIVAGLEDSALTEALSYALTAKDRPLVYGIGNSNRNLYGLDRGDPGCCKRHDSENLDRRYHNDTGRIGISDYAGDLPL